MRLGHFKTPGFSSCVCRFILAANLNVVKKCQPVHPDFSPFYGIRVRPREYSVVFDGFTSFYRFSVICNLRETGPAYRGRKDNINNLLTYNNIYVIEYHN
jgi:hypothetical protein